MNLLKLKLKEQGLVVLLFFMFAACNHWAGFSPEAEKGSGKRVSVKIGAINVAGRSQNETITRAAGGEKRIVGQPVIQDLGDGLFAEISVEEDVSALRDDPTPKALADGVKFRVFAVGVEIGVDEDEYETWTYTYISHVDGEVGSSSNPDLYVPAGAQCGFVCISYNSDEELPPFSYDENDPDSWGDFYFDNTKDFLYTADDFSLENDYHLVTGDTELSFTLMQVLSRVQLTLDATREGQAISNVSNGITLGEMMTSGKFSLVEEKIETTNRAHVPFTGWKTFGEQTVTSDYLTFIITVAYDEEGQPYLVPLSLYLPAGAITLSGGATSKETTISIPYSYIKYSVSGSPSSSSWLSEFGKQYTIRLRFGKCGTGGVALAQAIGAGGKEYLTHLYGDFGFSRCWMVENSTEGTPASDGGVSFTNGYNEESSQMNGYYYAWTEAAGACPAGWRLPSLDEAMHMRNEVLSNLNNVGKWWRDASENAFAGYAHYDTGSSTWTWQGWGTANRWWTPPVNYQGETDGYHSAYFSYGGIGRGGHTAAESPNYRYPVRCVRD